MFLCAVSGVQKQKGETNSGKERKENRVHVNGAEGKNIEYTDNLYISQTQKKIHVKIQTTAIATF